MLRVGGLIGKEDLQVLFLLIIYDDLISKISATHMAWIFLRGTRLFDGL
jgi:hypothetical protein